MVFWRATTHASQTPSCRGGVGPGQLQLALEQLAPDRDRVMPCWPPSSVLRTCPSRYLITFSALAAVLLRWKEKRWIASIGLTLRYGSLVPLVPLPVHSDGQLAG